MDNSTNLVALLESHAGRVSGWERTAARIAARWISVVPDAAGDPLVSDILKEATSTNVEQNAEHNTEFFCGWTPKTSSGSYTASDYDYLLSSRICKPASIMDYFKTSTSAPSESTQKKEKQEKQENSRIQIFCDGACTANGKANASAGYGVSVQKDGKEIQYSCVSLPSLEPQTNQRAELRALYKALKLTGEYSQEGVDIYTDSKYALDCLQKWCPGWVRNGWKKADKSPVLHQDILQPMYQLWKSSTNVRMHHVAAHTGRTDELSLGNARADELAQVAAAHSKA
jgi:ribonuclease HI